MNNTKYVILKSRTRAATGAPFGAAQASAPGTIASADIDVSVTVDTLGKNDLATVSRDREVIAIAPAMRMKLIEPTSNPPGSALDTGPIVWGVLAVGADTSPFTGDGITAAVLDTGIDATHPAFTGVTLRQQDFTGEGNGDQHGHGTHCAGTVFGRSVEGRRIGIAPGIKTALIGKVLDQNGSGSSDQILDAILWAADQGAHVISMSIGMDFPGYQQDLVASGMPAVVATSIALEGYRQNVLLFERLAAMLRARSAMAQATVIVAAAGNESNRPEWELAVSPPAVSDGLISVGALGKAAGGVNVARFSNTGVNLSAPGVDVVSAKLGGGLVAFNGTSMATPCVAGVAALWAEKLKGEERLNTLTLTSRLIGAASTAGFVAGIDPLDIGAGIARCPQ